LFNDHGCGYPVFDQINHKSSLMATPRKLKQRRERYYSAHHTLLNIAKRSLAKAEKKEPGWFNDTFVALTFAALAVEGLGNAMGDRVVDDWKDFESASPNAKMRLLAERLGVTYDASSEPWRTLRWLGKLRNQIAHPKPEHISDQKEIEDRDLDDPLADRPESKLERDITIANAKRCVKAVEQAMHALCENLPPEQRFGLSVDGWLSSVSLVDEG
jgi:hypothetical protein